MHITIHSNPKTNKWHRRGQTNPNSIQDPTPFNKNTSTLPDISQQNPKPLNSHIDSIHIKIISLNQNKRMRRKGANSPTKFNSRSANPTLFFLLFEWYQSMWETGNSSFGVRKPQFSSRFNLHQNQLQTPKPEDEERLDKKGQTHQQHPNQIQAKIWQSSPCNAEFLIHIKIHSKPQKTKRWYKMRQTHQPNPIQIQPQIWESSPWDTQF